MKYVTIKATCPVGIQLRLLGGTVHLASGATTVIEEGHLEHSSVKNAMENNQIEVLGSVDVTATAPVEAKVEAKVEAVEVAVAETPVAAVEEAPVVAKHEHSGKKKHKGNTDVEPASEEQTPRSDTPE